MRRALTDGSKVEAFHPADLTALLALIAEHSAYERYPAPDADLGGRLPGLLGSSIHCFVLRSSEGGDLLGYATATEDHSTFSGRPFGHLDCLYVTDSHRGRGGGQLLFDAVGEWSRERGHAELQWQTPDWNVRAHKFYRRQGANSRTKERFTLVHAG